MARYSQSAVGSRHANLGAFLCPRRAALAWDHEARRRGRPDCDLNFPEERPTAEEVCPQSFAACEENGRHRESGQQKACESMLAGYVQAMSTISCHQLRLLDKYII
jgi:hypothetical protein